MNKIFTIIAVVLTGWLAHSGLDLNSQTQEILKHKNQIMAENAAMADEITRKQKFKKHTPRLMRDAFAFFINQSRMVEVYSGTTFQIIMPQAKNSENIEDHYIPTEFRQVKGLPLTIDVKKFFQTTDMTEALNDIYVLENHTDFKVTEISTANDALIVKGELYGV